MRATIGLITRNIQIKGMGSDHGATLIVAGSRIKDPATKDIK